MTKPPHPSGPVPDFTSYPQSITELRAAQTNQGRDWTPKDVLIDALRDVDAGHVKPKLLMVFWLEEKEDSAGHTMGYAISSPCKLQTIATLELVKQRYLDDHGS